VKKYFLSTLNKFARRVFPGLELVFTKSFFQKSVFINVDFPTFERHTKSTSALSSKKTFSLLMLTDL
jgi:hypothetical protein